MLGWLFLFYKSFHNGNYQLNDINDNLCYSYDCRYFHPLLLSGNSVYPITQVLKIMQGVVVVKDDFFMKLLSRIPPLILLPLLWHNRKHQYMNITNRLQIQTRQELRSWLEEHSGVSTHAWIPVLSKHHDELSYLAIVEESICFGWIDSTKKRVGDTTLQRISPRRKSGNWTELNKERARRLIRLGLMTQTGHRALPDMSEDSFVVCPDVLDAIKADPETYQNFLALPPLYVRIRVDNIQSYPKESETYERRLKKFLQNTKQGQLYGDWNDNGRL